MLNPSTLKIYNASAGSGKTYYLILNYLIILFNSNQIDYFEKILILTFNKKVSIEIKIKILNHLISFSKGEKTKMFFTIKFCLKISSEELQYKSKNILKKIFYNYEKFNIITIDKFIHKIFKNSTKFLEIDKLFNIELDNKILIKKAIKIFLKNLPSLRYYNILNEYIKIMIDKGNRWNMKNYLSTHVYNFLLKESNLIYIDKIKNLSINKFYYLNEQIDINIFNIKNQLLYQCNYFFNFVKKNNIIIDPLLNNFFHKVKKKYLLNLTYKKVFSKKLENLVLANKIIKNKFLSEKLKYILAIKIKNIFLYTKKIILLYNKNYTIYSILKKNLFFLLTIYKIIKILNKIKKEKNTFFNVDINLIINKKIINHEILPYYYDNIGEKYQHYFIDEFQDTSFLQWDNIKILIENILSENGTVLLCGDPKQSIYRWRGCNVENFLNLINNYNISYIKEIKNSKYNYRSSKEIVEFNNNLYLLASNNLKNDLYKKIYSKNIKQKYCNDLYKKGYVEINFLPKKNYLIEVNNIIISRIRVLLSKGFKKKDIVILTRKNKEVFDLNIFFNERGIKTQSSDCFLLKNYWEINCIIQLLNIINFPNDYLIRIKWILLLKSNNKIICSEKKIQNFLFKIPNLNLNNFFIKLKNYGINLYDDIYSSISCFYILIEKIIKSINLDKNKIYIQHFLDFILLNTKNIKNSINIFLDIWNIKKNEISIYIPKNIDGIKIMTIHQSKGLEFKIVILPFIYWNIINNKNSGNWIYIDFFDKFDYYYVNMNKNMLNINITKKIYENYLDRSHFDNLNLLYVATTRATEKMFIFSIANKLSSIENNISYYLYNFLLKKKLFINNKIKYSFGEFIFIFLYIKYIFFYYK